MNTTRKRICKIANELTNFFFNVGSDAVEITIKQCGNGYELLLHSGYAPQYCKEVHDLNRFLARQEKNEGLEEIYWELAGISTLGQDSELHLIGQMIDRAEIHITGQDVSLTLFKQMD